MTKKMKDSGIEWIGDIPEDWVLKKVRYFLKETSEKNYPNEKVLSLYRDYGVIPKESRDDNHNVTSTNTSNYKLVEKGDLVINKMKAWQGSMGVSQYQGIISPAYFIFKVTDENLDLDYLHFALRNPAYIQEYKRISVGLRVGQWDLNKQKFKNLLYPFPTVRKQNQIVNTLNKEIKKIELIIKESNQSIIELKKYKQSLITEAVTKGLNPYVEMKDSGTDWIGNIPNHWNVKKMKFVTSINDTKRDFIKGDIYIGLENVLGFEGKVDNYGKLAGNSKERYFERGNILYSKLRPYLAKAFIADTTGSCSGEFIVFDYFKGNKRYLLYWLISQLFTDFINATSYGAKMPRSSWDYIKETNIPRPPLSEENEIVSYLDNNVSQINKVIQDKTKVIEELETYKKSLIYEYVTGKKDV